MNAASVRLTKKRRSVDGPVRGAGLIPRFLRVSLPCVLILLVCSSTIALGAGGEYITITTRQIDGMDVDRVTISGPPQPPAGVLRPVVDQAALRTRAKAVLLSETPAFDWSFGCSATSAAMIAGFYDRTGYTNMYDGPANGGVVPSTNGVWPDWVDGSGDSRHQCPLSATHAGLDGRVANGHVDDYWVEYGHAGPDPFDGNWGEHAHGDCTADFMKTSQAAYGNSDGSTTFWYAASGAAATDAMLEGWGVADTDGGYGVKLFYGSRGYSVVAMYNQYIQGHGSDPARGFTHDQYKAEIDAGRPVMIHVAGHTMVGVGYDTTSDTIYIHDTWDHVTHSMTWGGEYAGLAHIGVTVVQLTPTSWASCDRIVFASDRAGNYDIWAINIDGSGLQQLTFSGAREDHPHWSPDGTQLAYTHWAEGVHVMDSSGGGDSLVPNTDPHAAPLGPDYVMDWQPGDMLLLSTEEPGDGRGGIYEIDALGGGRRRLTDGIDGDHPPAGWSPDCQAFVWSDGVPYVGGSGRVAISPTSAFSPTTLFPPPSTPIEWSPNGEWIIFLNGSLGELWKIRPDGSDAGPVLAVNTQQATFLSDSHRFVYAFGGDLWLSDLNGSAPVQLTSGPASDIQPDASNVCHQCAFHVVGQAYLEGETDHSPIQVEAWLNGTSADTMAVAGAEASGDYVLGPMPCLGAEDTSYSIVGRCDGYATDFDWVTKPDGTSTAPIEVDDLILHSQKEVAFDWVYQPDGTRTFGVGLPQGATPLLSTVEGDHDHCGFIFATETTTYEVADVYFGDWESNPYGFWANNGVGGVVDMGAVALESVAEAPEAGYDDQYIPVTVGHTYCVFTKDGTSYAKLYVTSMGEAFPCCRLELADWWFDQNGSIAPDACLVLNDDAGATLHITVHNPCDVAIAPGSLCLPFPPQPQDPMAGRFFDPIPAGQTEHFEWEYTRAELEGFFPGAGSYEERAGVTSVCNGTETEWDWLTKTICVVTSGCWDDGLVGMEATGSGTDSSNGFGVSPGALDCYDAQDAPEPPAPPSPYTRLWFEMDASCSDTQAYTRDVKASMDCDQVKTWTMKVTDDGPASQVVLSWDPQELPPLGACEDPILPTVTLLDPTVGESVDMRSQTSYTYSKAGNPETRPFEIVVNCEPCREECLNLIDAGWHMITLQGPLCGECATTFGDLCCALCDDLNPCFIFHYDPAIGGYAMVPPCDAVDYEAGMGLWVNVNDPTTVCAPVRPQAGPIVIPLGIGWNQAGNPHPFSVLLSSARIRYQGQDVTLAEAHANGWVSQYLFGYDPGIGGYELLMPPDGELREVSGYWILAYEACELVIPDAPAAPLPPQSVKRANFMALRAQGIPTPPAPPSLSPMHESILDGLEVGNYPNPVRSEHTTTFRVSGPKALLVDAIRVSIYDQSGQLVWTEEAEARETQWHTKNLIDELLSNGVYLYQVWVRIGDLWLPTGIQKVAVVR